MIKPGEPGWEVHEKQIDDQFALRLITATLESQRKSVGKAALDALFHENGLAVDHRNGELYTLIQRAL